MPGSSEVSAYKEAGVDIDAGNELVNRIKPLARSTSRAGTMGGLGGFGAFFDVKAAGYTDPVLVAATDGVGTKIKIAIDMGNHNTIGIDLVAMCVNDLIVQGAEPLFFLDYFASGKLDVASATDIVAGIAEGCRQAGCALIGGETAEMPGLYAGRDYDLAGFAVGAVERSRVLTGKDVQAGDVVYGLPSSGFHSNGFSLVRKIVTDAKLRYDALYPYSDNQMLGEVLLTPTRIYVRALMQLLKEQDIVKGLAHITGGGLLENIPRILPDGLGVELDAAAWEFPSVFKWLKTRTAIDNTDLARTLNCGIGMVVICASGNAGALEQHFTDNREAFYKIGEVVPAADGDRVIIHNMDREWAV